MNNTEITCCICNDVFKTHLKFVHHLKKHHKITYKEYFDKYIEPFKHTCPYCTKERKWVSKNYQITCGEKDCISKLRTEINPMRNQSSINKIAETKLKRYGNPWYNNHEKTVKTCQANWGVDNVYQREDIKEKCKQIHLNSRGVDNPAKSEECKKKSEETCMKRWGKRHYLSTQDSKDKRIKYCSKHFGCDWFVQAKEFASKRLTKIEYSGIFFDSNLEVNFYKFCETNNLKIEYHPCVIKFKDEEQIEHSYFVDFKVNDSILVETKGKHLIDEHGNLKLVFKKGFNESEIKHKEMVLSCKQKCMEEHNVVLLTSESQFDTILNIVKEQRRTENG